MAVYFVTSKCRREWIVCGKGILQPFPTSDTVFLQLLNAARMKEWLFKKQVSITYLKTKGSNEILTTMLCSEIYEETTAPTMPYKGRSP